MARTMIMRSQDGQILHLECHESLPSVVELARKQARAGITNGHVIFSEKQTGVDIFGHPLKNGETESGVFMSCILRPSFFPSQSGFLGAISAVSLISALEEHTTKNLGLGWISDVFCEGRKIGTTSIEAKLDSFGTFDYIIVSFFVKITEQDFPPRLTDLIKKVFESENTSISLIIAKNILSKFFSFYPKKVKSPEKIVDVYKRKFILSGISTKYIEDGRKKNCKILGINSADGTLIIETSDGVKKHINGTKNIIIPTKIKLKNT